MPRLCSGEACSRGQGASGPICLSFLGVSGHPSRAVPECHTFCSMGCNYHLTLLIWFCPGAQGHAGLKLGTQLGTGAPRAGWGQGIFPSIFMNFLMPQRLLWPWGISELL